MRETNFDVKESEAAQRQPEKASKYRDDSISSLLLDSDKAESSLENPLLVTKPSIVIDQDTYLRNLWESNQEMYELLKSASDLEDARDKVYWYLGQQERDVFKAESTLHPLEKNLMKESIEILKNIIAPANEELTGLSALDCLWKIANEKLDELNWVVSEGFIFEITHLMRAIAGKAQVYGEGPVKKDDRVNYLMLKGRESAETRSEELEDISSSVKKYFKKYPSGLEDDIISWRKSNIRRITAHFNGQKEEWGDFRWQLDNLMTNLSQLGELVELSPLQKEIIRKAEAVDLRISLTPYYASLLDRKISTGLDHAIRGRIIPPLEYVEYLANYGSRKDDSAESLEEHYTSPADLVSRRYPTVAIVKAYTANYGAREDFQKGWDLAESLDPDVVPLDGEIESAFDWLGENPGIEDILFAGRDIILLEDEELEELLERTAEQRNIYRICIDTNTPVTLPMRWTDRLLDILARYHEPGRREICILTHFIHPYEITPEAREAVAKIRRRGIDVFNHQILSIENARRFEIAKLRHDLRLIGVTPYAASNMREKDEPMPYMVPIARILQESREEALLLSPFLRTDEPIINIHQLGRNNLREGQDHRIIMIRYDGARIYEMHPWEKNILPVEPYYYIDVPVFDYLQEMAARGENISDYKSIWFYY